jgi:MFS family permease
MSLTAPTRYRDVFAAPEFRVLFGVHTLLVLGESVKMLALAVLVYERSGSPLAAALAYTAGFLPYAVGGALLLSLADRMRPRTLLVWFHTARFAITCLLALGALPVPLAIALVALTGLFAPVGSAAAGGLLADLLDGDGYVLARSLFTMTSAGAQIAGQAAGGVLLLAIGPYGALWLAAASCLVAAAAARFGLRDRPARADPAEASTVGATWRVNRSLLADSPVRGLLLAQWLPISFAVGAEGVMIPYAAALGRPGSAGIMLAAVAGGMWAGNLVMGRFAAPDRRERLALPLALVPGTSLLFFLFSPGLVAASVLGAVSASGFGYELGLQRRFLAAVPEGRRGQALGLASTGIMTFQGLCMAAAGGMAELLTPGAVMALCGAMSVVAALALHRHLRPGHLRPGLWRPGHWSPGICARGPGPRPRRRPRKPR